MLLFVMQLLNNDMSNRVQIFMIPHRTQIEVISLISENLLEKWSFW